jgi:chromosome segregation ATPase
VETTRQYESLRASNEHLLDEKAKLTNQLGHLRNQKADLEQQLRSSNFETTKATVRNGRFLHACCPCGARRALRACML